MTWLHKKPQIHTQEKRKDIPQGLWKQCPSCQTALYHTDLEESLQVCQKCHYHFRLSARERLRYFLDLDDREELSINLDVPLDPLQFEDSKKYTARLTAAKEKTGEEEALILIQGKLFQMPLMALAFEFDFLGGSMGLAVGEIFTGAIQLAIEQGCPVVCFFSSGGARMQEGLISLMQMAKTSAVLTKLSEAKLPYISVLTDPTTGGVAASFAMLGDIIVAEPKALIGFAGQRVIQETMKRELPEGFQRSEFLLAHGALDAIIERKNLRTEIHQMLKKLMHCKHVQD
jgi:acetyl-CoA carboxylase carboxyl transferase subunit beta